MASLGYTLMTEQAGPRDLVRHAAAAERAGFDFESGNAASGRLGRGETC